MILSNEQVVGVYNGLKDNQEYLSGVLDKLEQEGLKLYRATGEHELEVRNNSNEIRRIKEVLKVVEQGLDFFEREWILPTGRIKKVSIWNPLDWKIIGKTVKFGRDMFNDIANIYRS